MVQLSLTEARRIALAAQGFDRPRPRVAGAQHLRGVLRRLGVVQIDSVNILIRAHYQVLFSRLGPYHRSRLDDLVYRSREFTEQWAHEASIVPVETWPLLRHRMQTHRVRPYGFESFLERNASYAADVLEQVRSRGPVSAEDLAAPDGVARRIPGDWTGTVPRAVLEAHFGRGWLAVAGRLPSFARTFDLAERLVPPEQHAREVDRESAQRQLLLLAARAHGVGTAADLADYYRMPMRDALPRIAELAGAGALNQVRVEGWREAAYLDPGAGRPLRIGAAALLSPFDPVVWRRDRVARLFEFDYRIEIYVPPAQRRWGYYVLPFLLGDRLAARVDLKAARDRRRLLVLAAYAEPRARAGAVAEALAAELWTLASWLDLDSIDVARRGDLARALATAVRGRK